MISLDDTKIVALYWDRNEEAIPVTAEKYGKYCLAVAGNILGNAEDAEECVNDTYLAAWNSIPPHRPAVLSTFLGKLTRNLSFNRYKKNTAEKRGKGEICAVLDELADIVSGTDSVASELERLELARAIDEFIGGLPKVKRDVFLCRYWYTESIAELSERFAMKPSAISMMLKRTRGKFQKYLTERGFEL